MPQRTLQIDRPLDRVWRQLQLLETWEGIGGMGRLRAATHRSDGTLEHFRYSLDTPVGTVDDDAEVRPVHNGTGQSMHVRTETKGLRVTVDIELTEAGTDATQASLEIDAEATSFLTRPLASALKHTLESGIDREGRRMVERLEA